MINADNYHEVGSFIDLIPELPCPGVPYLFIADYTFDRHDPSDYEETIKKCAYYDAIKTAPRLPPETQVNLTACTKEKIYTNIKSKVKTSAGNEVNLDIYNYGDISMRKDNQTYYYNKYYQRDFVTKYVGEKILKGSLTIEELVLPRYMFVPKANNRIKNDFLREYERQLKKLVFYTWRQLYHLNSNFVDCLAIDVSEVRT